MQGNLFSKKLTPAPATEPVKKGKGVSIEDRVSEIFNGNRFSSFTSAQILDILNSNTAGYKIVTIDQVRTAIFKLTRKDGHVITIGADTDRNQKFIYSRTKHNKA